MTNLTETDLGVIISRARCCSGDLSYKIATAYTNGISIECNLKKLKLLNTYIKILCQYQALNSTQVNPSGKFSIGSGTDGTLTVKLAGEIIGTHTAVGSNVTNIAIGITNSIDANINYNATRVSTLITVTGTRGSLDNNKRLTFITTGNITIDSTKTENFNSSGKDIITAQDNIVSETEIQSIAEDVNRICKTCQLSPNTTYIQ